jgi:cytochrome c oxidase cbb3-type subunit 3/ubiquinol-cytochrome c reductase cytochrome c subunit
MTASLSGKIALVAGALAGAALATSCGASAPPAQPKPAPPSPIAAAATPEDVRDGKALYDRYCALCHAAGAAGYAADNASQLRNTTFLRTATDDHLRIAIDRGRPGTPMSAFGARHGGPLGPDDTDRIIAYLRSLDRSPPLAVHELPVDGDAERGASVFRERCASCHGDAGQGKTALTLDNPTFHATASAGFIRYAIEHGRPGTPMPAFGQVLSPADIDDVTVTIRGWSRAIPANAARAQIPPLDRLVQNPEGPVPKLELRDGRFVPAEQLAKAFAARSRMVILDARPISDWHRGHIPGAYPTPFYDELDAIVKALPRDGTWIIAYCACPHAASGKVIDALRALEFPNTAVLDEGIHVWEQRGHPMQVTAAKPAK